MDITSQRTEFIKDKLDLTDLDADPFKQFEQWFQHACAAELIEPNAMSLATASPDGAPTLRTVLLKIFDHRGLVFFTNYESQKARQIAINPQVAALFPWLGLERQVKITGSAEKISTIESMRYFASRPRGSQLGAWISQQSAVIGSRALLENKLMEVSKKFENKEVPIPSFWGGYRIVPDTFEFWQGRANRLHDRFFYSQEADGKWSIERLAP